MIRVFITLDYELFTGESVGTPLNCIVRPMEALSKMAGKYDVKFIVFVDAAYLLRLQEFENVFDTLKDDYNILKTNIKELVGQGHDIQLHFHPQWLYSEWDDDKKSWNLDRKHINMSDMNVDDAFSYFEKANKLLKDIVGGEVSAFRANAYCLASFKDYIKLFRQNQIKIDSSVLRNSYLNGDFHYYDYRNSPSKVVYRFENDVIKEDIGGSFVELSISTFRYSFLERLLKHRKLLSKYQPVSAFGDGSAMSEFKKMTKMERFINAIKSRVQSASIDGKQSALLDIYLAKAVRAKQDLVLIGHPKNLTIGSLNNIERFIENHHKELVFCTTNNL